MSAADRVARILALVPWLVERPGASVEEAAGAFGVDRSTLLLDLDTIGYCGLPGLGGGDLFEVDLIEDRIIVRMVDELRRPLRLTPDEALRLIIAGETVAAALEEEIPALRTGLERLRAAVGLPAGTTVRIRSEGTERLGPIRTAIREGRRLRLRYAGRADEEPGDREVSPQTLHVSQGVWYLQAHDDDVGGDRTFRLDRIVDLEILDEPAATGQAPARPPRYEPGPDDTEVELRLAARGRWVAESVTPEETEELDDGGLVVRLWTDAPAWIAELVLAAAPHARVVRPEELATLVRDRARGALEAHDPGA